MATIEERHSKGEKHYRVKIRLNGAPPLSKSFARKTDALRWSQKIETEIREGRYFGKAQSLPFTFGEAVDRYVKHMAVANPRRLEDIGVFMNWWKERFSDHQLSGLTRASFAEAREILAQQEIKRGKTTKRRSTATVNRYVSAARTMLNCAVNDWQLIAENPIEKLRDLPEPKGRTRYLTDDEFQSLLSACRRSSSAYLYSIVLVAVSCGARKSEVNCTKWADVHLNDKKIVLHKTKNGEARVIYLHGPALEEIKRLHEKRKSGDVYVFPSLRDPNKPTYFKTSWYTALKRAGLQDFKFHDLRHTAASYLAMNGANMKDVAQILGHKSLAMTNRYAHLSQSHTSGVVERMNEHIFRPRESQLAG